MAPDSGFQASNPRQCGESRPVTSRTRGAKLSRPELFRLLTDAQPGDILLVEQVDRLSRLISADWEKLKAELMARRVRVVALDLPTSWMMATNNTDEFTGRMFEAINGMLLDMLAAVSRKDYDDRRRRQAQGQARLSSRQFSGLPPVFYWDDIQARRMPDPPDRETAWRQFGKIRPLAASTAWPIRRSSGACRAFGPSPYRCRAVRVRPGGRHTFTRRQNRKALDRS
jgi:hypothetical protein